MSSASKNPTVMNVYCTHTELTKGNSMLHLTIKKKLQRLLRWKVNTRPRLIKIVRQNVSIGENNTCLCGMCIDNSLFSSVNNPLV